jgi:hypothetical protein
MSDSELIHFLIQGDDCRIMFQFDKLTQDLSETDNGRQRTRVKHFIEHLRGILKIIDFGLREYWVSLSQKLSSLGLGLGLGLAWL